MRFFIVTSWKEGGFLKSAGAIILIVGLFMTVYAGFTYVAQENVADLNQLAITRNSARSINWKPNVGIGVMVIGATVLVLGRKHSMAT